MSCCIIAYLDCGLQTVYRLFRLIDIDYWVSLWVCGLESAFLLCAYVYRQVAQLWQRPRDAYSAILRGRGGSLRLNFKLKGYVSRQYLWTVRWGNIHPFIMYCSHKKLQLDMQTIKFNGCTTTLLLEIFTQRNFVADYSMESGFLLKQKKQKSLFEPPFRGLRGFVHTPYIARLKACGWLPIRHN